MRGKLILASVVVLGLASSANAQYYYGGFGYATPVRMIYAPAVVAPVTSYYGPVDLCGGPSNVERCANICGCTGNFVLRFGSRGAAVGLLRRVHR